MNPLRLEYLDPADLESNAANIKFHPPEQLATLSDFMADVGWAGALLYNEATGKLLDGHGRKELFAGKGLAPVLVGNWSEEQERQILTFLDPTGWMARIDGAALDLLTGGGDLLAGLAGGSERLLELASQVREAGELLAPETAPEPPGDDAPRKPRSPAASEVPDALWPSDNPWGVPLLDLSLQADAVEFPVTLWGTQGQSVAMRGTWHFYTADDAFRTIWHNPGKVLPSHAPCLVEPNYSSHDQTPFALDLKAIYKRRWLSRYWQSKGRRVFVDLNVHHRLLSEHEGTPGFIPAFLGVPRGWRAYATRAHGNRPEMLAIEYAAALLHSGEASLLFVVYGGGRKVELLCRERGWSWVPEQSDVARGKRSVSVSQSESAPIEVDRAPSEGSSGNEDVGG